jgi:hypothetical protein
LILLRRPLSILSYKVVKSRTVVGKM